MTEEKGPWGSTLSVAELAAIRSEGFAPVGQVMGSCVHQVYMYPPYAQMGGMAGGYSFGGGRPGMPGGWGGGSQGPGPLGGGGAFGGMMGGAGQAGWGSGIWAVEELRSYGDAIRNARRLALDRLAEEASGAHGVVGVRLKIRWLDEAARILEFTAVGTAVRVPGRDVSGPPFTSALSGEEFAKLLRSGYAPVGVVIGVCALWVAGAPLVNWSMVGPGYEVEEFSQAAGRARSTAVARMEDEVRRLGADGSVGSQATFHVQHTEAGGSPVRIVEFTALGTAVARFEAPEAAPPRPVLHL